MPRYTINIPDFDDVVWTPCDDGLSAEAAFNGVSIGVTTIDDGFDVSIWYDDNLCDGEDIDYESIESLDDAKEAAYDAALNVLHGILMGVGAVEEE